MTGDSASLERLRDIVVPDPVLWWPPAPGVYAALGLAAVLLLACGGWALRRRMRRAYRREALGVLKRCGAAPADLATLLKRAALSAYPREQVAGLTGAGWLQWLAKTGTRPVPPAVGDALTVSVYAGSGTADMAALLAFVRSWIRRHRVPDAREPKPET